jgi:hypothetical protein
MCLYGFNDVESLEYSEVCGKLRADLSGTTSRGTPAHRLLVDHWDTAVGCVLSTLLSILPVDMEEETLFCK